MTETRHDRNQSIWGDNGCGVMPSQSLGDFWGEQCNLLALEEMGQDFLLPCFPPTQSNTNFLQFYLRQLTSVFCPSSDLFTPRAYSSSPAWALLYLQDFEISIDFKASAEPLGSLIVDVVVADVQVNQHVIDFESFS